MSQGTAIELLFPNLLYTIGSATEKEAPVGDSDLDELEEDVEKGGRGRDKAQDPPKLATLFALMVVPELGAMLRVHSLPNWEFHGLTHDSNTEHMSAT